MDVSTAADHLGRLLEVTEERYPTNVRYMHLTEAVQFLSREYETRMGEGRIQVLIPSNRKLLVSGLTYDGLTPEVITSVWTFTDYSGLNTNLNEAVPVKLYELACAPSMEDLTRRYADTETWEEEVEDSDQPAPFAYYQYGRYLYFEPAFTGTVYARIFFRGFPPDVDIGSPEGASYWFEVAPWPVIYRAAEIACVWLEDEERIMVYERMRNAHMEAVNITDSTRGSVPLESTEA